jgi:hypothetical protein
MEVEINIPQSLDDITLKQYKEYEKIIKSNKDDKNSERFIYLKMIEIFCGLPYEYANKMRLVDFERIVTQITDILIKQPKLVTKFKMGDSTFGFIPDLEEMTYGEYVDLDTYIHDMNNIEKAMAVLYRPIVKEHKEKYLIDEYKGDLFHEAMLNMPMSAVVSSVVFFWSLGIDCTSVMMNYLEEGENKEAQQLLRQDLVKNGDITNLSTHSVMETLRNLKM